MKAEGLDEVRSACRFAARLQKKAEGLDEVNYELCTNCKAVFYVYRSYLDESGVCTADDGNVGITWESSLSLRN